MRGVDSSTFFFIQISKEPKRPFVKSNWLAKEEVNKEATISIQDVSSDDSEMTDEVPRNTLGDYIRPTIIKRLSGSNLQTPWCLILKTLSLFL
jgi:hypothetical protein